MENGKEALYFLLGVIVGAILVFISINLGLKYLNIN